MTHMFKIAIIGAGMAGLSAASALTEAGHSVVLFDKSRGSGGRMSTKRTESGDLDMGAQYFTARDHHFRNALQTWIANGWVAEWTPRLFLRNEDKLSEAPDDQQRYVGFPRMTSLSRGLLEGLELVSQTRIDSLEQDSDNRWELKDDNGTVHGPFDRVVVATPAPQAVPLLAAAGHLEQAASQVAMQPGWTLALAFAEPLDTAVEACFVRVGALDWISRNSSKPGRQGLDTWVLQSNPRWAMGNLETDKTEIKRHLLGEFADVLGIDVPQPVFEHAHRWLYARSEGACNWGALAAPEKGLYVCGDWCLGGRLENAWLSGRQAAHTLMGRK
ncbi:FAD-dependent oxidoreductase [Halopseudomonas salina]|uniref:FAD-dependent oxidoreductase n=2 Tax=Halopseudomonas salina TaxID=1323744 RepID=A0ABQ1Q2I6_9GAMM|nr:FAD-dependent oxidoreductase [Halopseudomonas salina]